MFALCQKSPKLMVAASELRLRERLVWETGTEDGTDTTEGNGRTGRERGNGRQREAEAKERRGRDRR